MLPEKVPKRKHTKVQIIVGFIIKSAFPKSYNFQSARHRQRSNRLSTQPLSCMVVLRNIKKGIK